MALLLALAFSVWAGVIRIIGGPLDDPISRIVLMYFAAALVVGPVIGLLLPLTGSWLGAAVVGAVGSNIVYGVSFTVIDGGLSWLGGGQILFLVGAFSVAGAIVGLAVRAFENRVQSDGRW